jgi:hypothetical protein
MTLCGVTKIAGLDEHASERDQFILIRPPVTGTTDVWPLP